MTTPALSLADLSVAFGSGAAARKVVHGVTLQVGAGEKLAIVGESGSGKSVTALAVMHQLGRSGRVAGGSMRLDGEDITSLPESACRDLRGRKVAMIFQDPMTALNPAFTIGRQLVDVIRSHDDPGLKAARLQAEEFLGKVGIDDPRRRSGQYPHELSGGMRQRVLIAMAIACRPRLLIADEPTTALDVTVQAQVVALLRDICASFGIALLFISHNLDLVAEFCDRIAVMYRGRIVESGSTEAIFGSPQHPYTRLLLDAIPRPGRLLRAALPGRLQESPGEGACDYFPRCSLADVDCRVRPALQGDGSHLCACWRSA
ncbi:ABC transporter ATP-binding protein [Bosea sp. TAF32]|uniref:ABC transporter ATP-binding protein n=1 Tax=Bosea sp. TAF32 TaxID=3237482 RepID=UPI003F8E1BF4